MKRAALFFAIALSLLLQACATPERVILLPGAAGAKTGALLVQGKSEVRLDKPYAEATTTKDTPPKPGLSSAEAVARDYGGLLAIQPARAVFFVVTFLPNSNLLTPETQPVLAQVRDALAGQPVGELVVIGHTDGVGTDEANDKLSFERASAVRELLVKLGIPRERISVEARGMREPVVDVPPQTAEPRNRRVEIKLR